MEWEDLKLGEKSYQVLRIIIFNSDKKAIFSNPMLLITNRLIDSLATAIEIYHAYLMRFKIERFAVAICIQVFKAKFGLGNLSN